MMEKRGEIVEGVTPPENPGEKDAEKPLEEHLTKRAADAASDRPKCGCCKGPSTP